MRLAAAIRRPQVQASARSAFVRLVGGGIKLFVLALWLVPIGCTQTTSEQDWLAKVGTSVIPVEEFRRRFVSTQKQLGELPMLDIQGVQAMRTRVLGEMIAERLFALASEEHAVNVSAQKLDEEVRQLSISVDAREWRRLFLEHYIDEDEWEGFLRTRLKERRYIESYVDPVTSMDVEAYYKENIDQYVRPVRVDIAQIVVDNRDLADQIVKQLKRGASFEQLAAEHSLGPERTEEGRLGYVEKEELPSAFSVAFSMNKGQVSEVVSSQYGFHIFKVYDRLSAGALSVTDVEGSIRQKLERIQYEQTRDQLLQKLRTHHPVEINDVIWERELASEISSLGAI